MLEAEKQALPSDLGIERLRQQRTDRLPAASSCCHEAGGSQPTEMPAHERLGETDVLDEVGDGRRAVGEALNDPQPIDVCQRLVKPAQVAQVVRLVDDGRQGRAETGG